MSNYFYQTRNGVRVRVRKGRNRVRFHKGKKVTRASVRGAIPTGRGEVYGKGAIVINDKSDSIKGNDGVSLRRKGGVVVAAGKLGKVKAGVAGGYKKGRKIDAIADYSNSSNTAEFAGYYKRKYKSFGAEFPILAEFAEGSTHYKRRSKKGKVSLVKKGKKKALKKLILRTAALAGGTLGAAYLAKRGLYAYANKVKRPTGTPIVGDIDKYLN